MEGLLSTGPTPSSFLGSVLRTATSMSPKVHNFFLRFTVYYSDWYHILHSFVNLIFLQSLGVCFSCLGLIFFLSMAYSSTLD